MLPTLHHIIPTGSDWIYEPKYDGYRMQVIWQSENNIHFFSRRLREITDQFPDIVIHFKNSSQHFLPFLPLILDGECCILSKAYKADFSLIQTRGKAKKKEQSIYFVKMSLLLLLFLMYFIKVEKI
nr:hypothetical protein [Terrilactibacillus tamarindi]